MNRTSSYESVVAQSKRLLPDAFWSLASNVSSVLAGLAVVKLVAVMVPAADYGEAGLVLGVAGLLTTLISNPLLSAQVRLFFESVRAGTATAHFMALERVLVKVAMAVAGAYLAVALAYYWAGRSVYLALAAPVILFVVVQPHLSAHLYLLEAQRNYRKMAFVQVASRVLQVPFLLGLLYWSVTSKASAVVLSQAVAFLAVFLWVMFSRERKAEAAVETTQRAALDGFSLALYGFGLFSWMLATSDRYLIDHFRDSREVGIYILNYGLWSIPFTVLNGWIDSFSRPRLYARATAGNWAQVVEVMRLKLLLGFGISLLGVGAIYFLGESISRLLIGQNYWAGLQLVMLIALAHVFFVTAHTASTIFLAAKKAQPLWITSLLAAGLNVGLNLYYIPRFGIVAAAASTLAAYAFWTVLLLISAFAMKRTLRDSVTASL